MNFWAKVFDLPQTERAELLDLHSGSLREVRRSLHDIRRINRYLGGTKVLGDATFSLLQKHDLQNATVLDIGTGSADLPLYLAQQAQRRKLTIRVLALDISARHLQIAREDLRFEYSKEIPLLQADAFQLPLRDKSVDIVISSLFLHHFRTPQIHRLLAEFERVSRVGWIVNDLVRHNVPLWFFRLTRPIFATSYLTRYDGEVSLRRAYTAREMQEIVRQSSVPTARVQSHFPFRMSIVRDKK